jgi:hypothetical protein
LTDDIEGLIDEDSHQFINQPSKNGLTVAEAGDHVPQIGNWRWKREQLF